MESRSFFYVYFANNFGTFAISLLFCGFQVINGVLELVLYGSEEKLYYVVKKVAFVFFSYFFIRIVAKNYDKNITELDNDERCNTSTENPDHFFPQIVRN